jgi:hypothetical protein
MRTGFNYFGFSFVGLPKTIQSNQGSKCISHLFQQVVHELNIKLFKSNAYHPVSQVTKVKPK